MFPGKLRTIRFEFSGPSVQAILDRLPTAQIIDKAGSTYTVEATVFGQGIKMFLLSQGVWIKVLSPPDFADEMRNDIRKMCEFYNYFII